MFILRVNLEFEYYPTIVFNISVRACPDTCTADMYPLPDKVTRDRQLAERFTFLLKAPGVVSQGVSSSQVGEDATAKLFTEMLVQTQLLQKS